VTAKRIGAVLVAVALIVIALVVRRTVLDDDESVVLGPGSSTTAPPTAATELVCASELAAPCRALGERFPELDVRVEPAGTTLDALADPERPTPLWATLRPFPEMVDVVRPRDPVGYTTEPLAASQLTIATPHPPSGGSGRFDALRTGCEGEALWACIGDHAGAPWTELGGDPSLGTVRPSVGLVEREAVALASFANAVAGYFGTPDIDPAAFGDASFVAWARRLAGAVPGSAISAGTPLATMVTRGGELDIAATTVVEVENLMLSRPDLAIDLNYPETTMWVEAVLAVPRGAAAPDGLADALTSELGRVGWFEASDATEGVPDATTMVALRQLWRDLT
jgi:hypothetical protein